MQKRTRKTAALTVTVTVMITTAAYLQVNGSLNHTQFFKTQESPQVLSDEQKRERPITQPAND